MAHPPHTALLGDLIGPDLAAALARAAQRGTADLRALDALEAEAAAWEDVSREDIGHSSAGRPIRMLRLGSGSRAVLAYGYVHPDEPLGAYALSGLIREWQDPSSPLRRMDVQWNVVLCADPDMAAWNARFARGDRLEDFLYGTIRPEHLAREVDYGFPIDHGIFLQPPGYDGARACWSAGRCVRPGICGARCGRHDLPAGPLPESRALAEAMRRVRPDLVVSLHDAHTGGIFSFLRQRPPSALAAHLTRDVAAITGLPRHLGQRIDSGRPWTRRDPDLIREPDLRAEERRFLRRTGADPALRYHGNVSAAQFLESLDPQAEFLVPEAPHFTHPDFGDLAALEQVRAVQGAVRTTRHGARYVVTGELTHPDGTREEVLYRMRTAVDGPLGPHARPVSVGMLGVEATARRRHALAQADAIWADLDPDLRDDPHHPFAAERRSIAVPAVRVNDASLRFFRLSASYDKPATVAHHADFAWRWDIHTAQRIGAFARFLDDAGGEPRDIAVLRGALEAYIDHLPDGLRRASHREAAALSQLARIVITIRHR